MTRYQTLALLCPFFLARRETHATERPSRLCHGLLAALLVAILTTLTPLAPVATAAPGDNGLAAGSTLAAGSIESDIDAYWRQIFASQGLDYWTPTVISMADAVDSGCGYIDEEQYIAFYCSVDAAVYWSIPVYERVSARSGGAVWVNIMAHEWAHHVQLLLGLNTYWRQVNDSVSLELEATCMGGAYVANARDRGLVDDDMINSMTHMMGGSDTHGSREQVQAAFHNGIDAGLAGCGLALS
jgi:predicted metalloprotease